MSPTKEMWILDATGRIGGAVARDLAGKGRLARVRSPNPRNDRTASWAHARVEWPAGVVRESWLRTGDGMVFRIDVLVTRREHLYQTVSNMTRMGADATFFYPFS
jgi:hypothetical protein